MSILKTFFTGKIPDKFSVFTAELVSISQALCWLKTTDIKKCVIFSDSLSSLQSLDHGKSCRFDITNDIMQTYIQITHTGKHIVLEWVPAHVGITGNEMADCYAKKALDGNTVAENMNYSVNELMSIAIPKLKEH